MPTTMIMIRRRIIVRSFLSFSLFSPDLTSPPDRKGTMVHPSFQKRRFGTILTQHTNSISQKTGGRTWAPARPSSHKMFNNEGFRDIAVIDNRTERWGGTKEEGMNWLVRRDEVVV